MGAHLGRCPFTEQTNRKLVVHRCMPSRSWICSVSRCRPRRMQRSNLCGNSSPPGSSAAWERVLPEVKNEASQTCVGEDFAENQKKGAADQSHTSCWACDDPIFIAPSWFTAPPGLTLPMGSRPDYWRNELSRALPLRGRLGAGRTAHLCATL